MKYSNDLNMVKILSHEETLIEYELMKQGNINARNKLIESCLQWAMKVVTRFRRPSGKHFGDFLGEVNLEIVKVIHKWIPNRGSLLTFINGVVKNCLNSNRFRFSLIYVPRHTAKIVNDNKIEEKIVNAGNSRTKERLECAQSVMNTNSLVTINPKITKILYNSTIEEDEYYQVRIKQLSQVMECLDKREKQIIDMYFNNGLFYRQIAEQINLTTQRVQQIAVKALAKLRQEFDLRYAVVSL